MVQCSNCEDWFHNTHLLPPVLQKSLDSSHILICRRCAANINLMPYLDDMHSACKESVEKYQIEIVSETVIKR